MSKSVHNILWELVDKAVQMNADGEQVTPSMVGLYTQKIDNAKDQAVTEARTDELKHIRLKFSRENWSFDRAVDARLKQLKDGSA